jgi:hypothetical protein
MNTGDQLFYSILHNLFVKQCPRLTLENINIKDNPLTYYHQLIAIESPHIRLVGILIGSHLSTTTKKISKIEWLNSVRTNTFLHTETVSLLENMFREAQLTYHRIKRLLHKYLWNTTPVSIHHDLYMNPIHENQPNTICILHHRRKYLFTLKDITNIMETALTNSPDMFSEPLVSKNPYTNMPFNKADLYNIYFAIKYSSSVVMSSVIHNYFLSNFHLKVFRDNNEVLIRNVAIERLVQSNDPFKLRPQITHMIIKYNRSVGSKLRLYIHSSFPTDKLVDIMRPYLRLYYISIYSLDINKQNNASHELFKRMKDFTKFNHCFGRQYVNINKKTPFQPKILTRYSYNDTHLPWRNSLKLSDYKTSHLALESDSDSEDDEEIQVNESHNESLWFSRPIPSSFLDNDDTIDINDSDDDILVDTDDDITAEVNNRIEYMSSHIQRMYPDMSNNNYEMPSLHATVDAAILDSNSLNEVISSTQDVISFVQQALNNIDLSNELEPVPPIQH